MDKHLIKIYFDGSCYNGKRPGKKSLTLVDKSQSTMGVGVVSVFRGKVLKEIVITGGLGTNNVAEWMGALAAVKLAKEYYLTYYDVRVEIYTESQVVANQFNGTYKIKQKEFREFYDEAKAIARTIQQRISLTWIPREQNRLADAVSKKANPYYENKKKNKVE